MPKAAGPGGRRPGDGRDGSKRLLALSGAVVVAAYAVGYVRTEGPARQALAAATALANATGAPTATAGGSASLPGATSSGTPAGSTTAPASGTAAGGSASGTGAPAASSSAAGGSAKKAATTYHNGSFTATGYGFHGPITVTLKVAGGRITSAGITACGTTYPCNIMDPLVAQVVSVQGPPVDYIGGATASSDAYYQAVTSALSQARA